MRKTTGHKHQAQQQPAGQGGILRQPGANAHDYSSPHAGSKPRYTHLTMAGDVGRFERAAAWSKATGRPLPPHMRIRTRPVRQAEPMGHQRRMHAYIVAEPRRGRLTGPQHRRVIHKRNHARAPSGPGQS